MNTELLNNLKRLKKDLVLLREERKVVFLQNPKMSYNNLKIKFYSQIIDSYILLGYCGYFKKELNDAISKAKLKYKVSSSVTPTEISEFIRFQKPLLKFTPIYQSTAAWHAWLLLFGFCY